MHLMLFHESIVNTLLVILRCTHLLKLKNICPQSSLHFSMASRSLCNAKQSSIVWICLKRSISSAYGHIWEFTRAGKQLWTQYCTLWYTWDDLTLSARYAIQNHLLLPMSKEIFYPINKLWAYYICNVQVFEEVLHVGLYQRLCWNQEIVHLLTSPPLLSIVANSQIVWISCASQDFFFWKRCCSSWISWYFSNDWWKIKWCALEFTTDTDWG